ncbi:hypothetical protein BC749_108168 [Flavobacterium araucananum]|uniref:Uncharacterized protein n=1 Tax=Flavobacterium araucananum TaxID=946678 RepID=A0A227NSQ0_9FLAO|nr:hypothetical protein [Flavobacterium araucananum]OXE99999.1 hypothetical protein B0A64_20795 [Flavobacterium araucananum]PWJ97018.1 hypothetical protein BC749_108168 [Flavobacterium araucananum]
MNLKTLNYIRNKAQLQDLFISQFSADYIRKEIHEILKETRKNATEGARLFAKNISTKELIIFMDRNGKPDGYVLSDELKIMLQDHREEEFKIRKLQNQF